MKTISSLLITILIFVSFGGNLINTHATVFTFAKGKLQSLNNGDLKEFLGKAEFLDCVQDEVTDVLIVPMKQLNKFSDFKDLINSPNMDEYFDPYENMHTLLFNSSVETSSRHNNLKLTLLSKILFSPFLPVKLANIIREREINYSGFSDKKDFEKRSYGSHFLSLSFAAFIGAGAVPVYLVYLPVGLPKSQVKAIKNCIKELKK